jgi:Kinesin motor domain
MSTDQHIRVACRLRPLGTNELKSGDVEAVTALPESKSIAVAKKTFGFDHVFGPGASNTDVYEECVVPMIEMCLKGYNSTIFAYGQTGSGKTFTMMEGFEKPEELDNLAGTSGHFGITPRLLRDLFIGLQDSLGPSPDDGDWAAAASGERVVAFNVKASMLEIYNENTYDLLDGATGSKNPKPLVIRDSEKGDQVVTGLTEVAVKSAKQSAELLAKGLSARQTGSTNMNERSSRSHAIFTIKLEQTVAIPSGSSESSSIGPGGSGPILSKRTSLIHLVDLAGSERASRTGATGARLQEGASINKGLLALGNVINGLAAQEEEKMAAAAAGSSSSSSAAGAAIAPSHIPYRDSKLTRLLKSSLGGSAHTLMLCCCSPADSSLEETLSSLRYASRARQIKTNAQINVDPLTLELKRLRERCQQLEMELVEVRGGGAAANGGGSSASSSSSSASSSSTSGSTSSSSSSSSSAMIDQLRGEAVRMEGEISFLRDKLLTLRRDLNKQRKAYSDLTLSEIRARGETRKVAILLKQLIAAVNTHAATGDGSASPTAPSIAHILQSINSDVDVASLLESVGESFSGGTNKGVSKRQRASMDLSGIQEEEGEEEEQQEDNLEAEEAQLLDDLQAMEQEEEEEEAQQGHENDDDNDDSYWLGLVDIDDLAMDAAVAKLASEINNNGNSSSSNAVADNEKENVKGSNGAAVVSAVQSGVAKSASSAAVTTQKPSLLKQPLSSAVASNKSTTSGPAMASGDNRQPLASRPVVAKTTVATTSSVAAPNRSSAAPGKSSINSAAPQAAVQQQQQPHNAHHRDRLIELNRALKAKEEELRSLQIANRQAAAAGSFGAAPTASSLAASAPPSSATVRALKERVVVLTDERDKLKKKMADLQKEAATSSAQHQQHASSSKMVSASSSAPSAIVITALQSQLQAKERELSKLKEEVTKASASSAATTSTMTVSGGLAPKAAPSSSGAGTSSSSSSSTSSQMQALLLSQAQRSAVISAEVTALRRERIYTLRAIKEEALKAKKARMEAQEAARRAAVAENRADKAKLDLERKSKEVELVKDAEKKKNEELLRLKRAVQERERQRRAGLLAAAAKGGLGGIGGAASDATASLLYSLCNSSASGGQQQPSNTLLQLMGSVLPSSYSARTRCDLLQQVDEASGADDLLPIVVTAASQGLQSWLSSIDTVAGTRFLSVLSNAISGSLIANKDVAFTTALTRQVGKVLPAPPTGEVEAGYTTGATLRGKATKTNGSFDGDGALDANDEDNDEDDDIVPVKASSKAPQKSKAQRSTAAVAAPTNTSSGAASTDFSVAGTLTIDPFDLHEPRPTDSMVALADSMISSGGHGELPLELRRKLEGFVAAKVGLRRAKVRLQELREARKAICAELQEKEQHHQGGSSQAAADLKRRRDIITREIAGCNDVLITLSTALEELQQQGQSSSSYAGNSRASRKVHWLPDALLSNGNGRRAITFLSNVVCSLVATTDAALHELAVSRKYAAAIIKNASAAVLKGANTAVKANKEAAKQVAELQGQVLFLLGELHNGATGSSNNIATIQQSVIEKAEEAASLKLSLEMEREARLKAELDAADAMARVHGLEEEAEALHDSLKAKLPAVSEALAVLGVEAAAAGGVDGGGLQLIVPPPRSSLGGASAASFGSKRSRASSNSNGNNKGRGKKGVATTAAITQLPSSAAALLLGAGGKSTTKDDDDDGFMVTEEPLPSDSSSSSASESEDEGGGDDEAASGAGAGNRDRKRRRMMMAEEDDDDEEEDDSDGSSSDDEEQSEDDEDDDSDASEDDDDDDDDESEEEEESDYDEDDDDDDDFGGRSKNKKKIVSKPAATKPAAGTTTKAPPAAKRRKVEQQPTALEADAPPSACSSCPCSGKCATSRCPCRAGGSHCGPSCKCKKAECSNLGAAVAIVPSAAVAPVTEAVVAPLPSASMTVTSSIIPPGSTLQGDTLASSSSVDENSNHYEMVSASSLPAAVVSAPVMKKLSSAAPPTTMAVAPATATSGLAAAAAVRKGFGLNVAKPPAPPAAVAPQPPAAATMPAAASMSVVPQLAPAPPVTSAMAMTPAIGFVPRPLSVAAPPPQAAVLPAPPATSASSAPAVAALVAAASAAVPAAAPKPQGVVMVAAAKPSASIPTSSSTTSLVSGVKRPREAVGTTTATSVATAGGPSAMAPKGNVPVQPARPAFARLGMISANNTVSSSSSSSSSGGKTMAMAVAGGTMGIKPTVAAVTRPNTTTAVGVSATRPSGVVATVAGGTTGLAGGGAARPATTSLATAAPSSSTGPSSTSTTAAGLR